MEQHTDYNQSKPVVIPLSTMVHNARVYINDAVTTIMKKTNIPPYLMDGIISEVLADIRKQELTELGVSTSEDEANSDG
jgi:hypothetical protein